MSAQSLVGRMGAGFTELNTDFGELCDGVIDTVMEEYDEAVEGVSGATGVLSRKKAELKRFCLRELGDRYGIFHLSALSCVRSCVCVCFRRLFFRRPFGVSSCGCSSERGLRVSVALCAVDICACRCAQCDKGLLA